MKQLFENTCTLFFILKFLLHVIWNFGIFFGKIQVTFPKAIIQSL